MIPLAKNFKYQMFCIETKGNFATYSEVSVEIMDLKKNWKP